MTIRAGRFFRAGTQGQRFFKAETGSDAMVKRSYSDLFKAPAEPDDSGGLGSPPTAEEGRGLMEWAARADLEMAAELDDELSSSVTRHRPARSPQYAERMKFSKKKKRAATAQDRCQATRGSHNVDTDVEDA